MVGRLPLPTLLSHVLVNVSPTRGWYRFTSPCVSASLPPTAGLRNEFERESDFSLAISANIVRVLDETGVRVRDLPLLTGVSKEAIGMAMGVLRKKRVAVVEAERSGSRTKVARLTPKGREAQDAYRQLLGIIEERWQARFGEETISTLREALGRLVGEPTAQLSPLFRGLEPYPDGRRTSARKPNTLPHYPLVRGLYNDI